MSFRHLLAIAALACACSPSPGADQGPPLASAVAPLTVGGCDCPAWSPGVECEEISYSDQPADGVYYVTTFGGPGDGQDMWVCGHKTTDNGSWAYAAGYARFGCGKIRISNPENGRSCVAEVADCGPNRCVEQAASFSGCASHAPIVDVSPFVTQHLFGILSSGWSERRQVLVALVDPKTPIGCPGGEPPEEPPRLAIEVRSAGVAGQTADFRPEGASRGVLDLYEGQQVEVTVEVQNDGTAGPTPGPVEVAWQVSTPWLSPVGSGSTGTTTLPVLAPGDSGGQALVVRAAAYSIGVAGAPWVRAWVRRVPGFYEEQVTFDDPVEVGGDSGPLRAERRVDVWSRTRWEFEGGEGQTEGWVTMGGAAPARISGGALVMEVTGDAPSLLSPPTGFPAGAFSGVELRARSGAGEAQARLYFAVDGGNGFSEDRSAPFTIPGDGEFHDIEVPLAGLPGWAGAVTRLRIDPAPAGASVFAFERIRVIPAATVAEPAPEPAPDAGDLPAPEPATDAPPESLTPEPPAGDGPGFESVPEPGVGPTGDTPSGDGAGPAPAPSSGCDASGGAWPAAAALVAVAMALAQGLARRWVGGGLTPRHARAHRRPTGAGPGTSRGACARHGSARR